MQGLVGGRFQRLPGLSAAESGMANRYRNRALSKMWDADSLEGNSKRRQGPQYGRQQGRFGMKLLAILGLAFGMTIPASAKVVSVEELWSHLFTSGPIVWQAPTEHLPKSFWVYQRDLPRLFPAGVITNAIVLGSLQSMGFPKPSTNQTCIIAEPPCECGNTDQSAA